MYTFRVRGRGPFPVDMLRYDLCWPANGSASLTIADSFVEAKKSQREVLLASESPSPITVDRWASFGWSVTV